MKLQAVTISINYADFLSAVAENRRHFDRWVVVTAPRDIETQEVCARYGMECVISRHVKPDGTGFHAVNAKWALINEALELLEQKGWALVLDADIFLPRFFRQRLSGLSLEPGCLYGVTGRKVIEEYSAFKQIQRCEPWTTLLARSSRVLGYFNLFSLENAPNRYLAREPGDDDRSHDDIRFSSAFGEDHRRLLPMSVIHVGKPFKNWTKRRTPEFEGSTEQNGLGVPVEMLKTSGLRENVSGPSGTAAVIGYFPGNRWCEIAASFQQTYLVDHFMVHAAIGFRLGEDDHIVLRQLIEQEAKGLTGLHFVGEHSNENIKAIPDGSVDLLYLPGEIAPDWMPQALHRWIPKLSDTAVICGDLFGMPQWKEASFTISLLLGTPDGITETGFWWKRWSDDRIQLPQYARRSEGNAEMGVILIAPPRTLQNLLITLYTLRRQWNGAIAVYYWGEENPSLMISASRLGAEINLLGEPPEDDELLVRFIDIIATQPFRRTLVLQPGMLPTRFWATSFAETTPVSKVNLREPMLIERDGSGGFVFSSVRSISANVFAGNAPRAEILFCSGNSAEWTDAAWEAWSIAEAEVAQMMAAEIRIATDVTVVTIVPEVDIGDFQRNWLSWRFSANTQILVILIDIPVEDVWLPGITESTRVVSLSNTKADNLPWLLSWIAEQCKTPHIIFLPATVAALPGAELWPDESGNEERATKLCWSQAATDELATTGNRFIPTRVSGIFDSQTLQAIAATPETANSNLEGLPLLVHKILDVENSGQWRDLEKQGWKEANVYQYISEHSRIPDRVQMRKNTTGKLLLADDVVVISLPERTDRRERIDAMMRRHGVNYRFIDGMRVADDEIDPDEISGVDLHTFKLAPTFLRGTVGCRRAHLQCLENAYKQDLRSLLIIEDDMHFINEWRDHYQRALHELPQGWLQLYFSAANFRPPFQISNHLDRLTGAYQTTAILYSKLGIKAALKCLRKSNCEIDVWMGEHLHPFGCSYVIRPYISFQDGGVSDIMGKARGITA